MVVGIEVFHENGLKKTNGKARKRRPIEREYLAPLNATVPKATGVVVDRDNGNVKYTHPETAENQRRLCQALF